MKSFKTFKCSGQILSNFLCQYWNDELIPVQILYLSSISWKDIPLYFFSSNNIYVAQKEPVKMKIFETFEDSGQILTNSLCQFWNGESILYKFCIQIHFHERQLLYTFLAQTIYTLLIRSPLKWKSLRLSSTQVKICQIHYIPIFNRQVNSSPNFVSPFRFMKDNSSVLFQLKRYILCSKGAH